MNRKKIIIKDFFVFGLLLIFLLNVKTSGQISSIVSSVKYGDAKEKTALSISAELFSSENISEINIAYKSFGQNEYKQAEMLIAGNTASVTIPAEIIQPPYIEFYLVIRIKDGSSQTYPMDVDKGVNPLQIPVSAFSQKDREINIISPADGELMSEKELLISISFIKAPDIVDIKKTKIFLNNVDISSSELIAGDLIILSGENLENKIGFGAKLLKVEVFDKEGNLYHTVSRSFETVSVEVAKAVGSRWKYNGYAMGESRSENFGSTSVWRNNISAEFNGSVDQWKLNGYAYLTSEEKNNLQPYNRYSASIQGGDWLDLKVGDAFPRFPNLIMDGKRVRGFTGAVNLGFINLQVTSGETVRNVEGTLIEKFTASNAPLGNDIIPISSSKYNGFSFGKVELGTYNRTIFAIRPSFGSGENFQFGLSYLHSKDDKNSIEFGARPQENIVIGTDLMFAFDNQNILFTSQAAVDVYNKDISSGNLTDAQIDSVFGPNGNFNIDPSNVKKARDILGKFITVNQYIGPWNPQEFSSLAAEAALALNYFNNSLRASYIYRGNEYQSFGQSFLRTDVKGVNLVDRFRMLDNKLFVSFGYESLQDNLQKTKIATTTYQTLSASVSIFPRINFPNITIGYNQYLNNNSLKSSDPINGQYAVDDVTNRILLQLSYDFMMVVKHNSSLSFTTSTRDDKSLAMTNAKFNSTSLNVNSYWTQSLMSLFGFVYSASDIKGIPFNYFTLTVGGRYRLLENKLQLTATLSPSFGDYKRQALEFTADYNVFLNFNLMFQSRIYRIPDASTNSIVGLTARVTI
ncbi:MAG: hypothetical protein NTX65_17185 [Ignavibacteriales bacterium]|nr:hypothetical protein [Ignavibacteriales bacterium]